MADRYDVFLSCSRNDLEAGTNLRGQLERCGLAVLQDQESIRKGELWLSCLQEAIEACGCFVVLVGRDGVRRWIGAETQAALDLYFRHHDDALRLPIFPILLGETEPATLPAPLRLFQTTPWNGADALSEHLLEHVRERTIIASRATFAGCPFVGLDAFRMDQAQLFFGRQKETLDALACLDNRPGSSTVRWLEINGNSGSGKSSLMNAGLLPLVDQGWLWTRTGFETWRRIGPMMPGERPVAILAEQLARTFDEDTSEVRQRLEESDERALARWLRGRKPDYETSFLLAIDQFEELLTFADPAERSRFDRLLAAALEEDDCPLFVISAVRTGFLERFEELPRLVAVRNRTARAWTLPPVSADCLREIISGPARLAGLDVSEVKEAMVAEARDEPGALPLVQNALNWLWARRTDGRLDGQLLADGGGLSGILSQNADALLQGLGGQRQLALELLFRLVKIDPEGRCHSRRRMTLAEAVAVAGGGARGHALIDHLAGRRGADDSSAKWPLRLITVTGNGEGRTTTEGGDRWVHMIHETLIGSKGPDAEGEPQPYWPTLWRYVEANKYRAAMPGGTRIRTAMRRQCLQLQAQDWQYRKGLGRLLALASWTELLRFRGIAAPGSVEQRYLRWSATTRGLLQVGILAAIVGLVGESLYWKTVNELPLEAVWTRWAYILGKELPLPEAVKVPEGTFLMGDQQRPGGQPIRRVTLAEPFYLTSTEVTFAQYDAFAKATGRALPNDRGWGRDGRPVIDVDWSDARAYARWLGAMVGAVCRLPSEAEWEYACRAGTRTEYALPAETGGSDDLKGKGLANCIGCGSEWDGSRTAPVGKFGANAWGLRDMHGNAWEWVEDCWHGSYDGGPDDGHAWLEENGGDCSLRVLRGGSWGYDPEVARCGRRGWWYPLTRAYDFGFRVVCSSPIDEP